MAKGTMGMAASVHQRLLNKARETSRTFNELLQHFAIERFIYRLSKTRHASSFVLKGALMFTVWGGRPSRPTMDIDLLGRIRNDPDSIVSAMKEACEARVEADGMFFDAQSATAAPIAEDAEYQGVRVNIQGNLGNARVFLQIDIGFGDIVLPAPAKIAYPVLLEFPAPVMNGYTRESTIAEKFHVMVKLGILNSRMKDFYDIWMLSRVFDFRGEILAQAIGRTFQNRDTSVTPNPTVFNAAFAEDHGKNIQWRAFLRKSMLNEAPGTFVDIAASVKRFLQPVAVALSGEQKFGKIWKAPGPWK